MESRISWCKPYGSLVAIITPMRNGQIDFTALEALINWHTGLGTAAIVVAGTTGEASALSHDKQIELVDAAVQISGGRITIIAGVGSNNTEEAISLTQRAQKAGASAGLSILPYYIKPPQRGIVAHFSAIAESCPDFPIIPYDVFSRVGVSITPENLLALATDHRNIVGLKEANGDMKRMSKILNLFHGTDFVVYSGDDFTNFPAMMLGAYGTISVVANVVPNTMARMWHAGLRGQISEARDLHYEMECLTEAMFLETNPDPVKAALALMEKCSPEIRLPMMDLEVRNMEVLRRILRKYQLIDQITYKE